MLGQPQGDGTAVSPRWAQALGSAARAMNGEQSCVVLVPCRHGEAGLHLAASLEADMDKRL